MLLKNIDQSNGLCNGTWLQVVRLKRTSIQAHIINGTYFVFYLSKKYVRKRSL